MLNESLQHALERIAADAPFTPDPQVAVRRANQLRRRRRYAVMGIGLLLAGGVGTTAAVWAGRSDVQTIRPASGATVLGNVNGVEITWLPAHFEPESRLRQSLLPELGPATSYLQFRDTTRPIADLDARQDLLRTGIAISVDRGTPIDLGAVATDAKARGLLRANGYEATWTTVRGHRALLWTRPPRSMFDPKGPAAYRLIWQESNSLTIEVDAFGGPTKADLEHVVSALVIGSPTRTDGAQQRDLAAIRQTFAQAYDAPKPAAEALAAVEDASTVASTLQRLSKALPQSVNSSHVTVGDIRFVGDSEAVVDANVVADWMGSSVSKNFPQRAVLIDGRWKVSRESFCASISAPGISCPRLGHG